MIRRVSESLNFAHFLDWSGCTNQARRNALTHPAGNFLRKKSRGPTYIKPRARWCPSLRTCAWPTWRFIRRSQCGGGRQPCKGRGAGTRRQAVCRTSIRRRKDRIGQGNGRASGASPRSDDRCEAGEFTCVNGLRPRRSQPRSWDWRVPQYAGAKVAPLRAAPRSKYPARNRHRLGIALVVATIIGTALAVGGAAWRYWPGTSPSSARRHTGPARGGQCRHLAMVKSALE